MQILTNTKHKNSMTVLNSFTDFPAAPEVGMLCMVDGVVYIYCTINFISTWMPLTNKLLNYIHTQTEAATTWTVTHNLGTKNLIYFIYDDNNNRLETGITFIDNDNATFTFSEAIMGRVIFFSASDSFGSVTSTKLYVEKYAEKYTNLGNVVGAKSISLDNGMTQKMTLTGNTTITFAGWDTLPGRSGSVSLVIVKGAHVISFPGVKWPGGVAPTLSSAGLNRLVFISDDNGTTVQGFPSGTNIS